MITSSNLDEEIPVKCNTDAGEIFANVEASISLDLPWLQVSDAHEGVAAVIGGGPSLRSQMPILLEHKRQGHKIFTMNGTMRALHSAGIRSDYYVMLDARPENLKFLDNLSADEFLIASQCHPSVFGVLSPPLSVTLWHTNYPGLVDKIGDRECALIGGGTTVGLQSVSIAYAMGYREIHLYGFDSSYAGESGHAYQQPQNDNDTVYEYAVEGEKFMATRWMARQAMEFQEASRQLAEGGADIYVHGFGLLPQIAKHMSVETVALAG